MICLPYSKKKKKNGLERINGSLLFLLPWGHYGRVFSADISVKLYLPPDGKGTDDRLRQVNGQLVSPFQSAFVPGWQLVDIAVIAGAIIVVWQIKGIRGFMWMVDLAKAWDSLDWNFLRSSMRSRGFPGEWVAWVTFPGGMSPFTP